MFWSQVREVLVNQNILISIVTNLIVRDDFLNGKNGAVKLSDEQLKYLDNIYSEVTIKQREESDATILQQFQKIAEHYIALIDGKQREIAGTTYSKLKDIITSITQCGYFDQIQKSLVVEEVIISGRFMRLAI